MRPSRVPQADLLINIGNCRTRRFYLRCQRETCCEDMCIVSVMGLLGSCLALSFDEAQLVHSMALMVGISVY